MGNARSILDDKTGVEEGLQPSNPGDPVREEVIITVKYTRGGPGNDVYEENRKFNGSWDSNHLRESLRFLKKVFAGTTDLQEFGNYKVRPPLAGQRIGLSIGGSPFPGQEITGTAPFIDLDGTPIFVGSAVHGESIQPCKISPVASWRCLFAMNGTEITPTTNYTLLLIDGSTMEWVPTRSGKVPPRKIAVEGGYEEDGTRLYHAMTHWNNLNVVGKTGEQIVCLFSLYVHL